MNRDLPNQILAIVHVVQVGTPIMIYQRAKKKTMLRYDTPISFPFRYMNLLGSISSSPTSSPRDSLSFNPPQVPNQCVGVGWVNRGLNGRDLLYQKWIA